MGVYTGWGPCYGFDHIASQHGHANGCQAANLLWDFQGNPSMRHSGYNNKGYNFVRWGQKEDNQGWDGLIIDPSHSQF